MRRNIWIRNNTTTRKRHPPIHLTYLSYIGNIELVSQEVEYAILLLTSIETEVANIGLQMNAKNGSHDVQSHRYSGRYRLENDGNLINNVTHF